MADVEGVAGRSAPVGLPAHGARDLTQGPITRTLIAFMIPTLGSSILQSLNGSINTIWIGRLLGENALAATANANTVMFLMLAFVFGFGTMRANGAVIAPLVILAIGLLPLRIGFAALMQPLIGADALWLSLPVASLSNLVLASIYYRRGTWKRQRMTMN